MEKLHNIWQVKWREALGEPIDNLPDVDCDFSLHFDIWQLDDQKLRECFGLFPKGEKILERAMEVRRQIQKQNNKNDTELLFWLKQMIVRTAEVLNQETIEYGQQRIIRGNDDLRLEVFMEADSPAIDLHDSLSQIIKESQGDIGYAAYFFLSEPLYRLANCYDVSHWVIWAMVEDEFRVDPFEPGYELYKIDAQAGWDNEGVFVFANE